MHDVNKTRAFDSRCIMPAYHSQYVEDDSHPVSCNMAILPLKTEARGPAVLMDHEEEQAGAC